MRKWHRSHHWQALVAAILQFSPLLQYVSSLATLLLFFVGCVASRRANFTVIPVGQTVNANGFWHKCETNQSSQMIKYSEEPSCVFGKEMHVGETFRNGAFKMQCEAWGYSIQGMTLLAVFTRTPVVSSTSILDTLSFCRMLLRRQQRCYKGVDTRRTTGRWHCDPSLRAGTKCTGTRHLLHHWYDDIISL